MKTEYKIIVEESCKKSEDKLNQLNTTHIINIEQMQITKHHVCICVKLMQKRVKK